MDYCYYLSHFVIGCQGMEWSLRTNRATESFLLCDRLCGGLRGTQPLSHRCLVSQVGSINSCFLRVPKGTGKVNVQFTPCIMLYV